MCLNFTYFTFEDSFINRLLWCCYVICPKLSHVIVYSWSFLKPRPLIFSSWSPLRRWHFCHLVPWSICIAIVWISRILKKNTFKPILKFISKITDILVLKILLNVNVYITSLVVVYHILEKQDNLSESASRNITGTIAQHQVDTGLQNLFDNNTSLCKLLYYYNRRESIEIIKHANNVNRGAHQSLKVSHPQ